MRTAQLALDPRDGARAVRDPKAWAWELKAREEAGERLGHAQRTMWRQALQPRHVVADELEDASR